MNKGTQSRRNTSGYARILGVGSCLPEKVIHNDELAKQVDTSHDWIVNRTGIYKRHIASNFETTATMGVVAAKKAIAMADIDVNRLDMVIVGTCTPDMIFPSVACLIQKELNLAHTAAFDINAACSSFIYALNTATQFIENGRADTILVVGSDVFSRIIDWNDRKTCVLFGDGAGAVIVRRDRECGIMDTVFYADGQVSHILKVTHPIYQTDTHQPSCFLSMRGRELYKLALTRLPDIITELLKRNHYQQSDINWLIPHQANARIIDQVIKRVKFPQDKVIVTVADHANTSSASIPLAFDVAVRDGRIKKGDTIIMEAFGGGLTWGGILFTF